MKILMPQIANFTSNPVFTLPKKNEISADAAINSSFAEQFDGKHVIAAETINPSWIDTDYAYDPDNPRKPNVRELVEALSGEKVEKLYEQDSSVWRPYFVKATDILYGTVSNVVDTRDWQKIMESSDIETAAADELADLIEPYIDVDSSYEQVTLSDGSVENILTAQFPVIKSKDGIVLSTNLSKNIDHLKEELSRFGGTKISFGQEALTKVVLTNFDYQKLHMIEKLTSGV